MAVLKGHRHVNNAVFSRDGKRILTAGEDGTASVWQIDGLDELLAMNCDWMRDYLKNPSADLSDRHLCDGIDTSK